MTVKRYVRLDFHILWRPIEDLQLGLGARNLLDDRHTELDGDIIGRLATDVERTL